MNQANLESRRDDDHYQSRRKNLDSTSPMHPIFQNILVKGKGGKENDWNTWEYYKWSAHAKGTSDAKCQKKVTARLLRVSAPT